MKTASAILLIASLGLLGGCSTSTPEPAPGPTAAVGTTNATSTRVIGRVQSDVSATTLHARAPLTVARQLVQLSTALAPTDALGGGQLPVETSHTDILRIAPQGVAGVYRVPIDTTDGEAYLFLSPQVEGTDAIQAALRDVIVLDPNGVRVNVRADKGTGTAEAAPMSSIPLAGHPVGIYTVQFRSGAPQVGLAIEARLASSSIVMTLKPSTLEHLLGNQSFVDATLTDGGKPILGAHVTADMISGQSLSQVAPVTFNEIGNGVYRAAVHDVLNEGHATGAYLADVRAEGATPSGVNFFRHGRTGFHYGVPTARISSIGSHRTLTDANGMISAFEVDVNVESMSLDRLEISGKLTAVGADNQEHPISIAHVGQGFDAGSSTVTLHFDAGHARLTGAEGNFYLRDLQLYSLGTNTLFHRDQAADNRVFPNVSRASLTHLTKLTPAQTRLVSDGVFRAD